MCVIDSRWLGGAWRWCVFCLGLLCAAAHAQYRFDAWTTDDGLPQNSVYAILQTRDGFLWFTTYDGLVRYNGAQFTIFNKANTPGLTSLRLSALYEDHAGNLWIRSEDGVLMRYRDGGFTAYTTAQGLPHNYIVQIGRTAEDALLVQTEQGLARFEHERFAAVAPEPHSLGARVGIRGRSGTVWYREGTELRRVKHGQLTSYRVPDGNPWQLYEDRRGRLWFGVKEPGGLAVIAGDALHLYTVKDGLPPAQVISFCEDRAGTLWVGTNGGGLVRFKDGSFTTFTTEQGLSSNVIRTIYEDREGTLWLGTGDNGLMRLTPRLITAYAEKDGMVGKTFYPILEDQAGNIWIANSGVNRFRQGQFSYYPLNLIPPHRQELPLSIHSLYEDRAGRLWLGGNAGLLLFQDEKFVYDRTVPLTRSPLSIYQDRQGAFWLGFNSELLRVKDGVPQRFDTKDGLQGMVQPIYEDRQGRLWIGGYGGLAQYVDGRLRFYTEHDGLSSNRIRAIYEDAEGVLWLGTYDGGLNRLKDGRFTRYTTREGMFSNNVFSILEDGRGNLWMGSNQGIHRVSRRQLNEFAAGKLPRIDAISYGKADGMLSAECNGGRHPAALKARDGRMWFPTLNGVAVVDPEAVTYNSAPPPVVIEQVMLDRVALDFRRPVALHPGQDYLEIAYAGLSFIKPEHVRFKYRLEGLDANWVEAGNRRVAYFSHLPAGSYTFHVIAANSDGVWNETGARLSFVVHPPFWRTAWFNALAVLACLTLGVVLYRARIHQLQRAQAAQETFARQLLASQEGERKRIAAELHDSLGQNLLVIKNWAALARRALEAESRARAPLDEVTAAAARSIEEVREIAHNLRPYHLDEIGLTGAVAAMAERVAEASGLHFTLESDELDGWLSPEVEINLYRIVQECLNNIVKHARATAAELSLRRSAQSLLVVIKDNGQGFDLTEVLRRPGRGFGLAGLAERVRLLGGKELIQSQPGQGTTITITLNLSRDTKDPHSDR
jgi:signal transduction histidine kinase/ligand-binding sensor domain-containing protein